MRVRDLIHRECSRPRGGLDHLFEPEVAFLRSLLTTPTWSGEVAHLWDGLSHHKVRCDRFGGIARQHKVEGGQPEWYPWFARPSTWMKPPKHADSSASCMKTIDETADDLNPARRSVPCWSTSGRVCLYLAELSPAGCRSQKLPRPPRREGRLKLSGQAREKRSLMTPKEKGGRREGRAGGRPAAVLWVPRGGARREATRHTLTNSRRKEGQVHLAVGDHGWRGLNVDVPGSLRPHPAGST